MFKTLKMSLKIDVAYAVNSFIYSLRHLVIFKDLFTDDIYKSKIIKLIARFLGIILSLSKSILYRVIYFLCIFYLSTLLSRNTSLTFIHIYFIFTLLGIFINNKLLNTSSKKYFSIILFNMDAKNFVKSQLFLDLTKSLLLNTLCFFIFSKIIDISLLSCINLIILSFLSRLIGEGLNIYFYKKANYLFITNIGLYFIVIISFLLLAATPKLNIFINNKIIILALLLFIILSIISLLYIIKLSDYKLIYKKLNTKNQIMNKELSQAYSRQAMVEVKNKDKIINNKKIKGKKGYDLFNTIFFERHKEILLDSAKKYSLIIALIYLVISYLVIKNTSFNKNIYSFLTNNITWFVIIMYFINRGAIVTQAMFYNCDHAMLTYNFYKEPKVLLNLFKKRLLTLIKINLLPALILGGGNIILLFLCHEANITIYILTFLFIITLSIFFSVHYLVIYYLLQPYNKEMQLKKFSYTFISLFTYLICYNIAQYQVNSYLFITLGIIGTIIYTIISLILVYKFSPKTFKIN